MRPWTGTALKPIGHTATASHTGGPPCEVDKALNSQLQGTPYGQPLDQAFDPPAHQAEVKDRSSFGSTGRQQVATLASSSAVDPPVRMYGYVVGSSQHT